jgi:uncharacterized protein YjbJ (UPF0337 family)
MDRDRVEGIGHQVLGAVKQGLGKILGDTKMEADGVAERATGRAQNALGSTRDEVRNTIEAKAEIDEDRAADKISPSS